MPIHTVVSRGCMGAALLLVGCQVGSELTAETKQGIIGGVASNPGDDAVVQLISRAGPCTGTLVAPNLVLTAWHCVAIEESVLHLCRSDGTPVDSSGSIHGGLDPSEVTIKTGANPSNEIAATGSQIVSVESSTICRNDIALVVLDRALDAPIMPMRLTRPTSIGEQMTLIGYGLPGNIEAMIEQDAEVSPRRLRRAGVPVLDIGSNRFGFEGGQAAPGTMSLGPGMCPGDSGGPAIAETTAAVTGIASIVGADSCADAAVNTYVQLAEYYEIVLKGFDHAGAEPWLEGEPAPMTRQAPDSASCSLSPLALGRSGKWGANCHILLLLAGAGLRSRRRPEPLLSVLPAESAATARARQV